jgi:hypothetical protein
VLCWHVYICDIASRTIVIAIKPETKYSFHAIGFGCVVQENIDFNIFFTSSRFEIIRYVYCSAAVERKDR